MPRIRAATIDEHKALTRSALLNAAKTLIREAGTADLPLGEIALAAGVGRTTLYDYFVDRDDLIATLVEDELPGVVDALITAVPPGGSASERLADLASRTVEFVISDPVLGV
ncbi:MAG TPA: TetR/AcrR family transcriptional regulator, partial [Acidimicrobiia bacterium]